MRALALSALLLAPLPAVADCLPGGHVFSCRIGAKVLELCQQGEALTYSFGPRGKPELVLAEPLRSVDYTPWPGVGSTIWQSVRFENLGYGYEVWAATDRSGGGLEGGVNVMQNERLLAQQNCDRGTISGPLDILYSLKESVGLCWDHAAHRWSADCG